MIATHILLDCFGTLVDFPPDGSTPDYARSYRLVRTMGARCTHEQFLLGWDESWQQFAQRARDDCREFSIAQVAKLVLRDLLDREPTRQEVRVVACSHNAEWNRQVRYLPAVVDAVHQLARKYRLAVVSNTNDTQLVPRHLKRMGLSRLMDAVVLSAEVGWRKPHPNIYAAALGRLGIAPEQAVFVGDGYHPDYVGPRSVGIHSYLIDPAAASPVPEEHRIGSLAELPARLADAGLESAGLESAGLESALPPG